MGGIFVQNIRILPRQPISATGICVREHFEPCDELETRHRIQGRLSLFSILKFKCLRIIIDYGPDELVALTQRLDACSQTFEMEYSNSK